MIFVCLKKFRGLTILSFLFPLVILMSTGCAGLQKVSVKKGEVLSSEASPCTLAMVIYEKTGASAKERPPWALVKPPDDNSKHFLVGMSGYHSTEREARDDSMRHAREEFARYTGVEVTELDSYTRETYGSSSSILDPTVSGKTQTTHETDAPVSRVKAISFYYETLHGKCAGRDMGTAYQYWVLAEIPSDEYNNVQTWKAKQGAANEAEKVAEEAKAAKEVERLAFLHSSTLNDVEALMAKADPTAALTTLQADRSRLYDASKAMETKGGLASSGTSRLQAMLQEIPSAVQRIRSSLVIDPGRGATVLVASDNRDAVEIPVWVWYKHNDKINPVSDIQLLLKESGGSATIAKGQSDSSGLVIFNVKGINPGAYEVGIDPKGGALASLALPVQETMAAVGTTLSVKTYRFDMAGAAKAGVHQLFKGASFKPTPVTKVVMGSVRYRDTRLGSEFGKRLETLIERELSQISGIQVVRRPETRGLGQLAKVGKARGIGMTDHPVLAINSPAIQAQLDGAEGALEVSYSLEEKRVVIDLRLVQAGTGTTLASAGASIDKHLIPDDLDIVPPSAGTDFVPLTTGKPGEIHLELTTQRGDGATFAKGEKIIYYVSTDRDAYLLLLYKDAENRLIQIYPNNRSGKGFHKAGEYMAIPDRSDPFDFTITPPFGVEQVWAFAATEPFLPLKGNGRSNDLTILQDGLNGILPQLRTHGKKAGVSYGEANVVVTTVKE